MRWSSFATVLGAALLPAASARALCRPDRSTTTTASTSVEIATTFETLNTDAATIATSIETSATVEITDASETTDAVETTGASDTTIAETQTATITTDITTVMTSSATEVASTTQAVSTTEAASTTVSEAPVITEFIMNASFEDIVNTDWTLNAATIRDHNTKARLGRRYVEYKLNNEVADGTNRITQAVSGLNTKRTYRLTAHAIIFSDPVPVKSSSTVCVIQVAEGTPSLDVWLAQWVLDFETLEQYSEYSVDFSPLGADIGVSFRLRCSKGAQATLAVGLDDISLEDVGPKLVG